MSTLGIRATQLTGIEMQTWARKQEEESPLVKDNIVKVDEVVQDSNGIPACTKQEEITAPAYCTVDGMGTGVQGV